MKYSEVIKAFENGSTKTYEATDNYKRHEMSISGSGYFYYKNFKKESRKEIESSVPAGGFSGNICRTLDWKEVKQSVTAAQAFEKWTEGHSVYYVDDSGYRQNIDDFSFKTAGCNITKRSIKAYTWYVEDES